MARPRPDDGDPEAGPQPGAVPPGAQQGGGAPPAAHPPVPTAPPANHSGSSDESSHGSPAVSGIPASYPPRQPEAVPYPPPAPNGPPERYPPDPPPKADPTGPETPDRGVGLPWSTGLFDCHEHETNAIVTTFYPCVTFGQIAEILDEGQMSCTLASVMYLLLCPALCTCFTLGSSYRAKLRLRYNLVEAPAEDWSLHLFCPCCALCQEFRELRNRGMDPALGYMGNLALQHHTSTVPPQNQVMGA